MVKFNICSRFLVILSKRRIFVTWQNFQKSQKMIKMKQKLNTSRTKHAIHTKIHRKLYQLCALKVANSPNEIGWRSATFEAILLFDKLYIFTQLLASKLLKKIRLFQIYSYLQVANYYQASFSSEIFGLL